MPTVTVAQVDDIFQTAHEIGEATETMISTIITADRDVLPDEKIISLIRSTREWDHKTCILRGAGFSTLLRRGDTRELDARGKKGAGKPAGIKARLAEMAKEAGIGLTAAYGDVKIFETYILPPEDRIEAEQTGEMTNGSLSALFVIQNTPGLERAHLLLAANSPDPEQALVIAIDKLNVDASYTAQQLRLTLEDTALGGSRTPPVPGAPAKLTPAQASDPTESFYYMPEAKVTLKGRLALLDITRKYNIPVWRALTDALDYYWKEKVSKDRTVAANAVK